MSNVGLRDNSKKLPYHLVSPYAMEEMVKVLEFGATKYAPRNWEKGLDWEAQCMSSLLRHVADWRKGEDKDQETGLSHLSHILCNAMFLSHFEQTGTGNDDRAKKQETPSCMALQIEEACRMTTAWEQRMNLGQRNDNPYRGFTTWQSRTIPALSVTGTTGGRRHPPFTPDVPPVKQSGYKWDAAQELFYYPAWLAKGTDLLPPLLDDCKVKVWLRNGEVVIGSVKSFSWKHEQGPNDIIRFRYVGLE